MAAIEWDVVGKRYYETGVEKPALYVVDDTGKYGTGVAWDGLIKVDESPSGADPTPLYANNAEYLNLTSKEKYGGTIDAYQSPEEFDVCDGVASPVRGLKVRQQTRRPFGLVYQTLLGNDTEFENYGRRLHIIYGAKAAVSSKSHNTINESPEAAQLSWTFQCTAVKMNGMKPTCVIEIDSTDVGDEVFKQIENKFYGTEDTEPTFMLPDELAEFVESITKDKTAGE